MKLSSLLLVGLAGISSFASADQTEKVKDPWLIRITALDMNPTNQGRAFSALGIDFPANSVSLNPKIFPEFDVSYFFTNHWATELVLTYPQQHDVTLYSVGKIGTVSHLPPTLMAQYHFTIPKSLFTPYAGVGVNYTKITDSNFW